MASDLATKANVVFRLRLDDIENKFSVFDAKDKSMKLVRGTENFFSHYANGCFIIKKNDLNQSLLTFVSTSMTKCSIVFVIKIDGLWRFRGGLIVTEDIGVIGYPLHTTFETSPDELTFPDKFHKNTVMIIGIETKENNVAMSLEVFAETGNKDGPYNGVILWNRYRHDSNFVFSPSLKLANAVKRTYIHQTLNANPPNDEVHQSATKKKPSLRLQIKPNVEKPKQSVTMASAAIVPFDELPPLPDTTDEEASFDNTVKSVKIDAMLPKKEPKTPLFENKKLQITESSPTSDVEKQYLKDMMKKLRIAMRKSKVEMRSASTNGSE